MIIPIKTKITIKIKTKITIKIKTRIIIDNFNNTNYN